VEREVQNEQRTKQIVFVENGQEVAEFGRRATGKKLKLRYKKQCDELKQRAQRYVQANMYFPIKLKK
jgi:hypothetical protein